MTFLESESDRRKMRMRGQELQSFYVRILQEWLPVFTSAGAALPAGRRVFWTRSQPPRGSTLQFSAAEAPSDSSAAASVASAAPSGLVKRSGT